ncbi:MAG: exodeoxyribonuclease V subunit gamma [Chlamydiales bacterium]
MGIHLDYTPSHLFFSNSVEQLFKKFKENLFLDDSNPFSKRILIIPNLTMERWIRIRLAEELKIAAGFETYFLENGLHHLFNIDSFPSKFELLLSIESELDLIQAKWKPLKKYLSDKEKRKFALSLRLTYLFMRYGVYGQALPSSWESHPKNWQEELWSRVFKIWTYPLRRISHIQPKHLEVSVHLFGFSHIPPLYFHFFQQLPCVYFYQLSPCKEFWSDLSKEHPFLTHFGHLGRKTISLIEESDLIIEEIYDMPMGNTQLHQLQRELLNLEIYEKIQDQSIELHISSTEYDEVYNLYQNLVRLLKEKKIEPKDILVMAPDISQYEPYILTIFKDLPYQIADMPIEKKDLELEAFFLLIELEQRRFNVPALLDLFHHPLFQKKIGWNEEDILKIREWIEVTGIRWGLDKKNRDDLLKKSQCDEGIEDECATWKSGIDCLLEELAISYSPKRINFSEAELLGEWKELIDRLTSDASIFSEQLTLRDWADKLRIFHERYFSESATVVYYLEILASSARHLPSRKYSFEIFQQLIREVIGEKTMTVNSHCIQGIHFSSMVPMRIVPAKIICLIGMNEEAFPRKESLFSLDMLKDTGDYFPSRLDFDRYLLLEILLSVREKLIISYLENHLDHQISSLPSSVITQLLPYISKTIKHPLYMPLKNERPLPMLFTYRQINVEIPSCQIEIADLIRPFRSPLRHYLYHQEIYFREEEMIKKEEVFSLSPLRKANLRKLGEEALKKAKREKDFPIGPFAYVAEKQLKEEIQKFPKDLENLSVNLTIENVQIVGILEGVTKDGLAIYEQKKIKGVVKHWPLFLLLATIRPEISNFFFLKDGKKVRRFFDNPEPYLKSILRYYFFSQKVLTPLFPDWIEPILKEDSVKLKQMKHYDPTLKWAMRGQKLLPPKDLILSWKEEAEALFKEMADAWF